MSRVKTGDYKYCDTCSTKYYCPKWKWNISKYCSGNCRGISHRKEKILGTCVICDTQFNTHRSDNKRRCCSSKCARKLVGKKLQTGMYISCKLCGKQTYKENKQCKSYCSKKCTQLAWIKPETKRICKECGTNFYRKPHVKSTYCSVTCLCRHNNKIGKNIKKRSMTRPEKMVHTLLNELEIPYQSHYRVMYNNIVKYYDVYVPDINLLIEVDGIYWHGKNLTEEAMNSTQLHNRKNDIMKNNIAKELGYNLQRIWCDEITKQKIEEILYV